ncbi:hypothetical protein LTR10_020775 [Elasticomyces elasticus]|nr:hypothetical protein LTR10_020775 [Elasticomyces elasticus]KAK5181683.1 hypothetical protein LTR44_005882 [Eurotiomycetes sp. CCFEE 6388]
MEQIVFDSSCLRIACISDTHNDDCRNEIPAGDIFVHAGDFTDDGTFEEISKAFDWISSLPHRLKIVVAGNHDLGLDPAHVQFCRRSHDLFTSSEARRRGIHYLDREVRTVAHIRSSADDGLRPLRVYGNPCQPDFLNSSYAFTYLPFPSDGAQHAWKEAPTYKEGVEIWVMHSPPKGHLDDIPVPPLTGCEVQSRKITESRPVLCVFGHYHSSWGIERVRWRTNQCGVEQTGAQVLPAHEGQIFDFSGRSRDVAIGRGEETIFVNAAWMTMQKRKSEKRNTPFLITIPLPCL